MADLTDHLRAVLQSEERLADVSGVEESGELGQSDGQHVRQLRQEDSVVKQLAGLVSQGWTAGGTGAACGGLGSA